MVCVGRVERVLHPADVGVLRPERGVPRADHGDFAPGYGPGPAAVEGDGVLQAGLDDQDTCSHGCEDLVPGVLDQHIAVRAVYIGVLLAKCSSSV